jgi:ABC-2 type transport system permease protein
MPIREKGYYNWDGELKTGRFKWLPMFRNGIKSVYKKKWSKLLFIIPLVYTLFFLAVIYISSRPELKMFTRMVKEIEDTNYMLDIFYTVEGTYLFFIVLIGIFAGGELISNDLKFKSFTLYLSRPLSRLDYIKGKFSIVLFYLLMNTLIPGILLLFFKLIFLGVGAVPLRALTGVFLFSILISFFLASLCIMFSSLSANSRLVKIVIFIVYIMSNAMAQILLHTFNARELLHLSIYENIDRFAGFLFGTHGSGFFKDGFISGIILLALTLIFITIVMVRIKRVEV